MTATLQDSATPLSTDLKPLDPPRLATPWYTEARQKLQDQARQFAMTEVLPIANELDPQKAEMPRELIDRLGELGYFGITIPKEDGGLGLGVFEYCMVAEELARAWMSVASILARSQGLGTTVADPARRKELVARSARGQWVGAVGFSEPQAGSDLANIQTRAVDDGDAWIITGTKRWIGNSLAADFIQLLCRERDPEPGEPRSAGLITLLIEKEPGSFPEGLTGTPIDKIGYHGFRTWELSFDGLRVPKENLLLEVDQTTSTAQPVDGATPKRRAFQDAQRFLNIARVQTAARAVGLARAAVEDSTLYLQSRQQFGQPIGHFQALRFELAQMAAKVEQARAFYRQVAHLLDEGVPCEREAAMVKLQATEMAIEVTNAAMQLHGGNGYTTELQVERHWRDARLTTIFEGTSEIQKKIISDRLLGRPAKH
jgi:alkylation response protein AidB-like acyl-CoA dehydrogenase